jgi:hypothetical protein
VCWDFLALTYDSVLFSRIVRRVTPGLKGELIAYGTSIGVKIGFYDWR